MSLTRRAFAQLIGASGAGAAASSWGSFAIAQAAPKVVIVGGGAGGATVAGLLKREMPNLDVTLIEINSVYSTSFLSNLYLGGLREIDSLSQGYGGLSALGVRTVQGFATDVDTAAKRVRIRGTSLPYDKLVLSPGIDIKFDSIAGYSAEAAQLMPHAYTTAADGKRLLRRQLEAMRDGGVVAITVPSNPYRCPPAPYERACMIAHYLKTRKPKSKVIILDPKKSFSKENVFKEAFEKYYKDIIELNQTDEIDDFAIVSVDVKTKEIATKAGKTVKADVANIIPQQRAGEIAHKAGAAEGDWCPVDIENFASKVVKDVYVLGDSAIASEMPKGAYAANSQAKAVVADILAELAGKEKFPALYPNICWSLLAPDDSVKVGATYSPKNGKLEPSGSFVSLPDETAEVRKKNAEDGIAWYDSAVAEMFAKPTKPGDKKG